MPEAIWLLRGCRCRKGRFIRSYVSMPSMAAEKALKAVYQHYGWMFRYTHDLEELINGLKGHGAKNPPEVDEAIVLTSFAWEARYPGLAEPVTAEEYQEALKHAEAVVEWAEHEIGVR